MMGAGYYGKKAMAMDDVQMYDAFNDRAEFGYKFCAWPRRCYTTNKWLFMETAVRGRRVITGPGEPVIEDRWYHRNEALIMMLRGFGNV